MKSYIKKFKENKSVKQVLNKFTESVLSAITEIDTENITDEDILRIGMSAELSAINLYKSLATYAKRQEVKDALLDIAKEEKVHVYEFQHILRDIDQEEVETDLQAQQELKDM